MRMCERAKASLDRSRRKQLVMNSLRWCICGTVAVFLFFVWSLGDSVLAQCLSQGPEPASCTAETKAERYVLQQVAAGTVANFLVGEKLAEEKDRVVRGCFIRQLLTNPGNKLPIHRHGIMVENAIVCGRIDLNNDEVHYDVALDHCIFMDDFDITQSHFAKSLSVARSAFEGEVDFQLATIGFDLTLSECQFGVAGFNRVHVAGDWLMVKATFAESVDFTGTEIAGDLVADGATFSGEADFGNMKIEGDSGWPGATFSGPASFANARLGGNLMAEGATFGSSSDFVNIKVEGNANLRKVKSQGDVNFGDGRFTNLFLDDSTFVGAANFTRTKMDTGFIDKTDFKTQPAIENMTFQYISPASWDKLQKLATGPTYNAEFYSSLEALFRRHGHPDQADEVFIAQQRRERQQNLTGLRKVWNLIQDWLVGYGRHLEKLLVWSALFILIGYFSFRREAGMKTRKPEDAERYANKYSGFWYTVDLFLPVLSLGDAEIWTPEDNRRWAIRYKRLHIILGHLLVPIGLAAWAGIIK